MNGIPAWLGAQMHVIAAVISAVISNGTMPARQVAVYTLVVAVLATAVIPKVLKALKK